MSNVFDISTFRKSALAGEPELAEAEADHPSPVDLQDHVFDQDETDGADFGGDEPAFVMCEYTRARQRFAAAFRLSRHGATEADVEQAYCQNVVVETPAGFDFADFGTLLVAAIEAEADKFRPCSRSMLELAEKMTPEERAALKLAL